MPSPNRFSSDRPGLTGMKCFPSIVAPVPLVQPDRIALRGDLIWDKLISTQTKRDYRSEVKQ